MAAMEGLDDLDAGGRRFYARTLRRLAHIRHLMAERLQQTPDAVIAFGRADQDRHDQPFRQLAPQIAHHFVAGRLHVAEQFFHQMFVIIGQPLQHLEARFLLAGEIGDIDHFRRRMWAIDKSPFQRQIDKAGGHAIFPNGNLAQQQRRLALFLQLRQQFAQRARRMFDLVDEEIVGNFRVRQRLQIRLQHLHLGRLGLAHDHRRIDRGKEMQRIGEKFDRAGAIQKGEILAQIPGGEHIHLHAHLPSPGLGGEIAQAGPAAHRTFACHRAGDGRYAFQQ